MLDLHQKNNLLGDVVYGLGYGHFVGHALKQLPNLAPTLKKLDNRINEILKETEGERRPIWFKN